MLVPSSYLKFSFLVCVMGFAPRQGFASSAGDANQPRTSEGVWAVRIDVPVAWESNAGIRDGEGVVVQWARTTRVQDGNIRDQHLQICGFELPDYTHQQGSKHGTVFPTDMFDDDRVPQSQSTSYINGSKIGDSFKTEPAAFLLGLDLPHALQAPWPARGEDLPGVIDHDGDGYPGITLWAKSVEGYSYPPASMLPFPAYSVRKLYVAVRAIVGIKATLVAPDRAEGSAHIPVIDDRLAMSSHIIGCELLSGELCSPSQADFLDRMQPLYKLAGTPRVVLSRVADDADCNLVRTTLSQR